MLTDVHAHSHIRVRSPLTVSLSLWNPDIVPLSLVSWCLRSDAGAVRPGNIKGLIFLCLMFIYLVRALCPVRALWARSLDWSPFDRLHIAFPIQPD